MEGKDVKNKTFRLKFELPKFGNCNPPQSYSRYNSDSLSRGRLLFHMKFEKSFLTKAKNDGGGESGLAWKRYKNLGNIDIFKTLTRPIIEMGSFVHLFTN